jgi:hypothetical protein
LGDLDGNGTCDLAVGEDNRVRMLYFGADGLLIGNPVLAVGKFASGYGSALAALGDLDGDGVTELLIGADRDDYGSASTNVEQGAVFVAFLAPDGTLKSQVKSSTVSNGFTGVLDPADFFGSAVAVLGDLDGDGTVEVAVGAPGDDDGPDGFLQNAGAVWILSLMPDGRVDHFVKISAAMAKVAGLIDALDGLGSALACVPDLDGDGLPELAIGASGSDGLVLPQQDLVGAAWLVSLEPNGAPDAVEVFLGGPGGVPGVKAADFLGLGGLSAVSVCSTDTCRWLAIGAPGADSAELLNVGVVHLLLLDAGEWTTLDGGLAGTHGLPGVTHAGWPCGGSTVSLTLDSNQAASVAFLLVVGVSELSVPAFGGTLVPTPNVVLAAATASDGTATLAGQWPQGLPSGTQVILQFWVHDTGTPAGLSASNAIRVESP